MTTFYLAVLIFSALILLAALSSALAYRFGAPLLLLFLGVGLIAGSSGFGIRFDNDALTFFVGSLALAVILFDSGFGTSLKTFRASAGPSLLLATLGVAMTAGLVAVAAAVILDFDPLQGLLLGAIVASTDAAAVFFLMRIGGIKVLERVSSTLEVESGINDPMAIFLTITLVTILSADGPTDEGAISLTLHFLREIGFGIVFGLLGGVLTVLVANHFGRNRGLAPILVLTMALLIFSATGAAGGSGFMAVYVAGLLAGNRRVRYSGSIRHFQEGMTWLAQIVMFLLLGLLATPRNFPEIAAPALALALFLVFVARPIAVWLCLWPFKYTLSEKGFISWIGLRGAASILLAILPRLYGLENAGIYFNIVFIMVLMSLMLQGWTLAPVARFLSLVQHKHGGTLESVEIDLAGNAKHELVVYRLGEGAPVLEGARIPRWAIPSLVVRDGRSMRYFYAGSLKAGDYLYLFVAPGMSYLLDRIFSGDGGDDSGGVLLGSHVLVPERPLKELIGIDESIEIPPGEAETPIADYMKRELGGRAVVADRLHIGSLSLIVRDIDDDNNIVSVGIWKNPDGDPKPPLFDPIRRALTRRANRRHKRTG
ncbi:potassium/proton antiporter [Martelella endophytica]|uniref:Potassium transporter n=1 Tax=Martelella endophytica TaxID=1486262 RepID=A0A0D5LR15_MAREN|nr:potassium/proton antiporter [Martelella endophytica]AJY46360.1 potassium transporter [Martelella endophytica]